MRGVSTAEEMDERMNGLTWSVGQQQPDLTSSRVIVTIVRWSFDQSRKHAQMQMVVQVKERRPRILTFYLHPRIAMQRTARRLAGGSTSSTPLFPVSASPAFSPQPQAKPSSSLWYTSRPTLLSTLSSLSQSTLQTRTHLFRSGILPSIHAPLTGPLADPTFTAVKSLDHPRERRWLSAPEMGTYLRNGLGLKSREYKAITSALGSLEGLLPYAALADALPSNTTPTLITDPVAVATNRPSDIPAEELGLGGLQSQLTILLDRFLHRNLKNPNGEEGTERIKGVERRLGKMDEQGRIRAVGRRKESSARVWIVPTLPSLTTIDPITNSSTLPGQILINSLPLPTYFALPSHRTSTLHPLLLTSSLHSFNIFAITSGGGLAAQAEAVGMGIARALIEFERLELESGAREETRGWREILKQGSFFDSLFTSW